MKFSEILDEEQVSVILSKSLYWEEVSRRDNNYLILRSELSDVVQELGLRILKVLEEAALQAKSEKGE